MTTVYEQQFDMWQRRLFVRALMACGGHQTKAAKLLGIHRNTLHRRLRELNVSKHELKAIRECGTRK